MLVFSSKMAFTANLVFDLSWILSPKHAGGYSRTMYIELGVYENGRLKNDIRVWSFDQRDCKSDYGNCAWRFVAELTSALRRGDKEFDVDAEAAKIEQMELLGCD